MRLIKIIAAAAVCLGMFTGCGIVGGRNDIINLLSSPKLSQRESRIVQAISEYLGQDVILKYPRRETGISPVQTVDLSGKDGEEAVVLYSCPSLSGNVRIAVLENINDVWRVINDYEGYGSEIYKIDFAQLIPGGEKQIIVGYTFADSSEKLLSVYFFSQGGIYDIYTVSCQDFMVMDITGDKTDDLILAGVNADNQQTRLKVYSHRQEGKLQVVAARALGITNARVTGINYSKQNIDGSGVVLVDYYDTYHKVYTQGFALKGDELDVVMPGDVVQKLWHAAYPLNSKDVNGDGFFETPTIIDDGSVGTNLRFMEWTNFLVQEPEREYYGVCNISQGVFFPLPDEWQNYIKLGEGENGSWSVSRTSDSLILVDFSVVNSRRQTREEENRVIIGSGISQIKLVFDPSVSQEQRDYICGGMIYLK